MPKTSLQSAQELAARKGLVVVRKFTPSGKVAHYRVFRKMNDRVVFIGERLTEDATLALVKRAAS